MNALGRRLGKGEAEGIAIGLENEVDFLILDDFTARSEAKRLGLQVKGTLSIIRRLMILGKVSVDVELLYKNLISMGFRIKESLFWKIFGDLGGKNF